MPMTLINMLWFLTKAKLHAPSNLEDLIKTVENFSFRVEKLKRNVDLRSVPRWVRGFFS